MNRVKMLKFLLWKSIHLQMKQNHQKIDNISDYHSAEFEDNTIRFWIYYSAGKGIVVERKPI